MTSTLEEQPFLLPYPHLKIPLFNKYASFCYMLYIKDPSLFFLKTMHYKPYSAPPILNFIYKSHFTYTTNNNTSPSLNIKAVIQFQGSSDSIILFFSKMLLESILVNSQTTTNQSLKSDIFNQELQQSLLLSMQTVLRSWSYSVLLEINR